MQEEYFDIVDKNNKLTGEKSSRPEAHSKGLWHRTVHIFFFREKNEHIELLVHLRAKDKDTSPNKWDTSFGGHIKAGESIQQAVVDEVKEETGLNIKISDLIEGEFYKKKMDCNREFIKVYYYKFDGDSSNMHFSDEEVQQVKWMTTSDIKQYMRKYPEKWTGDLKWVNIGLDKLIKNYIS